MGYFYARGFGGNEGLVSVCIRCDQTAGFHDNPLIRAFCTVFF